MTEERYERLFDVDYETLLDVGARIVELERHFSNQRGFDRTDDVLPFEIDGLEEALDEYYKIRGWNDDGTVPDANVSVWAADWPDSTGWSISSDFNHTSITSVSHLFPLA